MAKELLVIALSAESEAVKLAAVKDALDRGGLKAPSEVVLSQGETTPWEQIFEGIAGNTRAESRRARGIDDEPPTQQDWRTQPDHLREPGGQAGSFLTQPPTQRTGRQPSRVPEVDRERDPQRPARPHIIGEAALEIAAEMSQRAIESPHRQYPRP